MSTIAPPVERPTARALVRGRAVCCSRCGAEMKPEAGGPIDEQVRYLWWRCSTGHLTDALPVPTNVSMPVNLVGFT